MRHISKREMDRWHCQWHRIPSESIHRAMRLLDQTLLQPTQPLHIYSEGKMEVEYMKSACVREGEREREKENIKKMTPRPSTPSLYQQLKHSIMNERTTGWFGIGRTQFGRHQCFGDTDKEWDQGKS